MANTLDDLNSWRDRLVQARASGVRMVRDAFRSEVQYANDSEMAAALRFINSEIAKLSAVPVKSIRFHTSKGI